jgi:hypothetical protein
VNDATVDVPDRPLTADEAFAHDELYSEAQTLGDEATPRAVREGGITFGRPTVYPLDLDDFPELVRRRPAVRTRTFALIEFPFDLDELSGPRRYTEARFRVELNTPDAVATSLWPVLVTTPVEVETSRTFGVQADLSLGALTGAPSAEFSAGRTFRYTDLRPVVTSFGAGQAAFSWTFTAQDGRPLVPSGRRVFAVVDLPAGAPAVLGTFVAEVVVVRRRLNTFDKHRTLPSQRAFRLQLADGTIVLRSLGEG